MHIESLALKELVNEIPRRWWAGIDLVGARFAGSQYAGRVEPPERRLL